MSKATSDLTAAIVTLDEQVLALARAYAVADIVQR